MQGNKTIAIAAALFSVFLLTVSIWSARPPEVKPSSAPANEFSAERAYGILGTLLAENKPHPVGSPQNKIVKQRIMAELDKLGIEFSEQRTWGCSAKFSGCAFVENVIAIIPGEKARPYVALMSHYDSVPMAPGAGDDGAAVVAILESARILAAEAPFKHPIMLLFTDGEEMGLLGAEGFYLQHELASEIGVVLDFEGSGTTGLSIALRTSRANQLLIETFANETAYPNGASLTSEIFRRMPNDTDFSTSLRAGIPGIDFAFTGERNHYHTPNDNVANMDLRTIQHHGENMLPLTRALASADLDSDREANLEAMGGTLVYASLYGYLMRWGTQYEPWLLIVSLVLLVFGARQLGSTLKGTALGAAAAAGIILSTSLVGFAAFKIIGMALGTIVSWPATYLPWRATLVFSTLTGGLLVAAFAGPRIKFVDMFAGVWALWFVFAALLTAFMPDAAIVFTAPTLAAAAVFASATLLPEKARPEWLLLSLVVAVPVTLGSVLPMEQSQGYRLIAAVLPIFGLYIAVLSPLLNGVRLKMPIAACGALTLGAMVWALASPLYSDWRPQQLNIQYYEDLDEGTAFIALQSANPVRGNLSAVMNFNSEPREMLPFSSYESTTWAETKRSGLPGPTAMITAAEPSGDGRVVEMTLQSQRGAASLGLVLPETAGLTEFRLDGRIFTPELLTTGSLEGHYAIRLRGTYDRAVQLQLTLSSQDPVEADLYDVSTELPGDDAAELFRKRPPLASPVHSGDQAVLMRKVTL